MENKKLIKCLECGFETQRLQWTHFKYKCSGKFNNCKEYKKVYPEAELVSKELKDRTKVTLTTLIEKYGKEQGQLKWEEYKQKQAISNSFEYKKEKFGWSQEDFDNYNSSRSQTLENMIKRYGEQEGVIRWQNYCERQAYTNQIEYFIEKYGKDKGKQKYQEVCAKKCSIISNDTLSKRSSLIEIDFVNELEKELGFCLEWTANTKQFVIYGNERFNLYDVVHKKKNIEFHGDYWHCNPLVFEPNFFHKQKNRLALEIWKEDEDKRNLLKERNIDSIIVWESDYRFNKVEVIEKCKTWILNENE